MKRVIKVSLVVIALVLLVMVMRYHPSSKTTASSVPLSSDSGSATTNAPNPTPSPAPNASFKDGTYRGDSVDVGYGIVEVSAVISGGKITDVKFLQLPNDREHSIEVSNFSAPRLRTEAIQAQSANVDVVSGATSTSEGFNQSLQAALDKAKA